MRNLEVTWRRREFLHQVSRVDALSIATRFSNGSFLAAKPEYDRGVRGEESGEFPSRLLVARLFIQPDRKVDGPWLRSFLLVRFFAQFEFSRRQTPLLWMTGSTMVLVLFYSNRIRHPPPLKHASVIPSNWFAMREEKKSVFIQEHPRDEVRLKSNYFQLARFPNPRTLQIEFDHRDDTLDYPPYPSSPYSTFSPFRCHSTRSHT